jgi:hypothetical protein
LKDSALPSAVKVHFKHLINTHFSPDSNFDFYDTATAFSYEISGFMDNDRIFNCDLTETTINPGTPENLVTTQLKYRATVSLDSAISHVLKQWVECLRYSAVKIECVSVNRSEKTALIQCLTITQHNAASITFILTEDTSNSEVQP